MEEILLFPLDGGKAKVQQSIGQEDPDLAQYMSPDRLRTPPADLQALF